MQPVKKGFDSVGIRSYLVGRRDHFHSPQFVWLQSCLHLCVHQMNRRALTALVVSANSIAQSGIDYDSESVRIEADARQIGYLEFWAGLALQSGDTIFVQLSHFAKRLIDSRRSWREIVGEAVEWLPSLASFDIEGVRDVDEDRQSWRDAEREILKEFGEGVELDRFLQCIALRSKERSRDPDAVCLSTIHGSKGLEFDNVWVMGVVDSILPSWQSLRPDAKAH